MKNLLFGLPASLYISQPRRSHDTSATVDLTPIGQKILERFGEDSEQYQEFYDVLTSEEAEDFKAGKPVETTRWSVCRSEVGKFTYDGCCIDLFGYVSEDFPLDDSAIRSIFTFTAEQRAQFLEFLKKMNAMNWGLWPSTDEWPMFDGMPSYTLTQHEGEEGALILAKFAGLIQFPNSRQATRTGLGKGVLKRFPHNFIRI